uniref:Uncharacterized protein n=1 Tax=Candidatus Kentrum sp. LPFa TaxID=2126335 RepID=A0A450X8W0_9GAMM|nr:MAG: hypothetical protein BECKLPF1236A_GA0070988_104844 [Candidatus Kentron sp. LPFa]VFK36077.1 MAG: hypothetical protein BECKLPF1236C_GA0070990_104804 [Candidatus Kentron sp. LPFa]
MKDDPIVEEIRAYRSAHAARHGNDLDKIFAAIKEGEKKYGGRLVNRDTAPTRAPARRQGSSCSLYACS